MRGRANKSLQALMRHGGMTESESKEVTIASFRHLLPEIATARGEINADANEIGGWASSSSAQTNPGSLQFLSLPERCKKEAEIRVGIMAKRYAGEAGLEYAAAVKRRQVEAVTQVVKEKGGLGNLPKFGGWSDFLPPGLR